MEILNGFIINDEVRSILFSMCMGLIAGCGIAAGYVLANKGKKFSKNFAVTVLLLRVIMAMIIPFIATDLRKTLSLAGVFALVRFRSIPGDSKDILYTFFCGGGRSYNWTGKLFRGLCHGSCGESGLCSYYPLVES